MAEWTQELKDSIIQQYLDQNPTPETSPEIVKEIAEAEEQSANGVRMVLIQAGVYVKKDKTEKPVGGAKRSSKEESIAELKTAIRARNLPMDEDILDKLTGKAAVYVLSLINQ